jgi:hypothetical protein
MPVPWPSAVSAAGPEGAYKFAADANVQSFVLLTPLLDEARAYARSLEIEPRTTE